MVPCKILRVVPCKILLVVPCTRILWMSNLWALYHNFISFILDKVIGSKVLVLKMKDLRELPFDGIFRNTLYAKSGTNWRC